jgi:N-acetylneuraminic acid mutarotase
MPWHGGKKYYHDDIYALHLPGNGGPWKSYRGEISLPAPVAYGASVSVDAGLVCMGGETEQGLTDVAYIISAAGERLLITPLPPLPVPLSNAASVSVEAKVYLAGGITPEGSSSALWCIDTEELASGWQRMADMPLPLVNSVMAATVGDEPELWMLGGRTRGADDDMSLIRSEVISYSVNENRWQIRGELADENGAIKLAAGTGIALDQRHIAIFGGNDGEVYNRVEKILSEISRATDTIVLTVLRKEYISLQESHPGFSREVILFDTETGTSLKADDIPGPAQVTTNAVSTPFGIIIPSGEIRPGVRTEVIRMATFR